MSYYNKDFLLSTKTAKILYHTYAKRLPIFDYHCHLSEIEILENLPFRDLYEIWLAGDHYKWRLMRNFGIDEKYITGKAPNYDKFCAYCKALGTAYGNPLYHWSQVELEEYFGCNLEINEKNADAIWNYCNKYIAKNKVTPQSLIEDSNVRHIFTTGDLCDNLETFMKIKQKGYKFTVAPAFRADKIMSIEAPDYTDTIKKLEGITHNITDIEGLERATETRLLEFLRVGTKASDIALQCVLPITEKSTADAVFKSALKGEKISDEDARKFKGYLTYSLMKLYGKHNLRTEIHLGALRNNNSVMLKKLGADTGFDSIAEDNSINLLSRLFDKLNSKGLLPPTIIFNLNPKLNTEIMSLIGCFQSSEYSGKMQYGPAWWFLDNKVGMENHLRDLTATGHIATFIGMLTDSRSLLSYPRHRYFRRILCNYFGGLIENGEMTSNLNAVGEVIENICYFNSVKYFDL